MSAYKALYTQMIGLFLLEQYDNACQYQYQPQAQWHHDELLQASLCTSSVYLATICTMDLWRGILCEDLIHAE